MFCGSFVSLDAVISFLLRESVSNSIDVDRMLSVSSNGDWVISSTSWPESLGVDVVVPARLVKTASNIVSLTYDINVRASSSICDVIVVLTTVLTSSMISIRRSFINVLAVDVHGYTSEWFSTSIDSDRYQPLLSLPPRAPRPELERQNGQGWLAYTECCRILGVFNPFNWNVYT